MAEQYPWPAVDGYRQRMHHLIAGLTRVGEVEVVALDRRPAGVSRTTRAGPRESSRRSGCRRAPMRGSVRGCRSGGAATCPAACWRPTGAGSRPSCDDGWPTAIRSIWSGTRTWTPGSRCTTSSNMPPDRDSTAPRRRRRSWTSTTWSTWRCDCGAPRPLGSPRTPVCSTRPGPRDAGRCRAASTWSTSAGGTAPSATVRTTSTTWSCAASWTCGAAGAPTPWWSATVRALPIPTGCAATAPSCGEGCPPCSSSERSTTSPTPRPSSGSSAR